MRKFEKETMREENDIRFSQKRTVKSFTTVDVLDMNKLYDNLLEYINTLSCRDRVVRLLSAEKGLRVLHNTLAKEDVENIGDCYNIIKLVTKIILTREGIENSMINKLSKEVTKLKEYKDNNFNYPKDEEFIKMDVSGISSNYLYTWTAGKTHKTSAYTKWLENFPRKELPAKEYWEDVDFSKPIEIFINYVLKPKIDHSNCDKSLLDLVFNGVYGIDDAIVHSVHSKRVGNCEEFYQGKIFIYLKNL